MSKNEREMPEHVSRMLYMSESVDETTRWLENVLGPVAQGFISRRCVFGLQLPHEYSNGDRKRVDEIYKRRPHLTGIFHRNNPVILCALPEDKTYDIVRITPHVPYLFGLLNGHNRVRFAPRHQPPRHAYFLTPQQGAEYRGMELNEFLSLVESRIFQTVAEFARKNPDLAVPEPGIPQPLERGLLNVIPQSHA